ncbi:MAG: hypothetical protein ACOH5I_18940 [Oligoflexus sp.]
MQVISHIVDYVRVHLFTKDTEYEWEEQVREQVDFDEWMRIMLS